MAKGNNTAYGDGPAGDHLALFNAIEPASFGSKPRMIVSFMLCKPDRSGPQLSSKGAPYYAVITCNPTPGNNPTSQLFAIRKAMLRAEEYDAFRSAIHVPDWDVFTREANDGSPRFLMVRVVHKPTSKGGFVAAVVAIRRPRDGQWESVVREFDGPLFSWLTKEGQKKELAVKKVAALSSKEGQLYASWDSVPRNPLWLSVEGKFVELDEAAACKLDSISSAEYEVAKIRHKKAWPQLQQSGKVAVVE